jgi:copper(I)-binding protein
LIVRSGLSLALLILASVVAAAGTDLPIRASDAWIRWLPAGLPGAGYLTLTNTGSRTCVLIGAQSADFADVSFHQTHSTGGMSSMTPVDSIVVKPHDSVRLAVGGLHLMLMQPNRPLHPGDTVVVSLRFSDGQTLDVSFEVRTGGGE